MSHANDDFDTLSRRTSVSRATTTVSRRASLIQKNTAAQGPNELRPSDILLNRFVAWKSLINQLIQYFEGIADIENNTATTLLKLGGVIQVPFREGNQFMGEGGLQDVYYKLRDGARAVADTHASLGRTVDSSIVQHLIKLKSEVKAHIRNIQQDTGKLAVAVAKERELSVKAIADLSKAITVSKNTPMKVSVREDPYVNNQHVMRQLRRQVNEENNLQKSIIIMQANSAHFEEGIVRSIQSAWATFDEWQSRASVAVQETWKHMGSAMAAIAPEQEWVSFAARSDHLLEPDTPLRKVDHIEWPGRHDPAVEPVHDGMMERKKRFTKTYRESYFVLTPTGYLHEYKSSDPNASSEPIFSLFLLACTLGPASGLNAQSHKFHIEFKSPDKSGIKVLTNRDKGFTFRCRSRSEMLSWWNDLRMLCARSLMATEEMDRSGPIHAAVRGAGYNHEDELDSDSGAGSSVEEEDDELDDEDLSGQHTHAHYLAPHALHDDDHHDQRHHEEVPAYTRPPASSHIPIGPDGYAIEKKDKPLSGSADDRHRDIDLGPIPKAPAPVTLPSRHDSSDSEDEGPAKTASVAQAPPAQSKSPSTEDETASQSGILGRFKEVLIGSPARSST